MLEIVSAHPELIFLALFVGVVFGMFLGFCMGCPKEKS